MVQLITPYLLQNKSISIPGLGTIYVERIPAQSDFVNRQLLPPSYHYRFDKYFDAPGKDFFTYLAAKKNIEDYEAIKLYNEWALQVRNRISADQPAVLEGVGSLTRDSSGDIIFEPAGRAHTLAVPVPAERIIRTNSRHMMIVGDKEVTNVEMNDYLQVEVRRKKNKWWVYALIAAVLAIAAIIYHFYSSDSRAPFGNQQSVPAR